MDYADIVSYEVPCKEGAVKISLVGDRVRKFDEYYYPLTNDSLNIFAANIVRKERKRLSALLSADVVDVGKVEEIFRTQLEHYIRLAEEIETEN
jgi:hypothetical protein